MPARSAGGAAPESFEIHPSPSIKWNSRPENGTQPVPAQLRRKVALITGASRGIGAACAGRLAEDGFAVAINSEADVKMTAAAEAVAERVRTKGGHAVVLAGDVSDASSVERLFGACEVELGPVDALILNAAARTRRPWLQVTEAEWDHVSAVNLKGAFLCARRAFSRNESPDCAAIVTLSSVQAETGAADVLPYATTKAGLIGFTRSLARELGPRGIRVNCVMPGAIQTEEELESFPDQEAVRNTLMQLQCLQRRGVAEDVASAVSFLVGPDSRFITGQTLCVDGGWVMR